MSVGFSPALNLASHAGAKVVYDPAINMHRATDLPAGISLAGAAAGVWSQAAVIGDSRQCGRRRCGARAWACRQSCGRRSSADPAAARVNHPYPIFTDQRAHDFIDFDEDLQSKDIVNTVEGRLRRHPAGEALFDRRPRARARVATPTSTPSASSRARPASRSNPSARRPSGRRWCRRSSRRSPAAASSRCASRPCITATSKAARR